MTNLKLINSKIIKIIAERNPDFNGKLEITSNIKINSIDTIKESKDILKINYLFEINYKDLGKISLNGILYISSEVKKIKDILKNYKDKNFENPEYLTITNLIIQKASIKAFELEEELGLPIHIKLPTISFKK
jgi:hypothetical protein